MDYLSFTRDQWKQLEEESKQEFSREIGGVPKRRAIAQSIPNNNQLDILNMVAIIMLGVVALYGLFKLGLASYPIADRLTEVNLHTDMTPFLEMLFQLVIVASAGFVGVFGMLYFKLVAESSATRNKIEASKRAPKWRIEWWSPRLPYVLVILTIIIMVVVSNQSITSLFDFLFNNTIVVMELALSYPVGIWLSKRQARTTAVNNALAIAKQEYDRRMESYEKDKQYLRILSQNAMEAFFSLKSGRQRKSNENLRKLPTEQVERMLSDEYKRWRGGVTFSREIVNWLDNKPQAKRSIHDTITTRQQKQAPTVEEKSDQVKRRKPRNGKWDADSLRADMIQHSAPVPATEQYINDNYLGGYDARKVWRNGLRDSWNS